MKQELWEALFDPLNDPVRKEFEAEFPEIPAEDLCRIVVEFRIGRAEKRERERLAPDEVGKKIKALEKKVASLQATLLGLPVEVDEAIPTTKLNVVEVLQSYREALWGATPYAEPQETFALVGALRRHFLRAGLTIEPTEASRFVQAVRIVFRALGTAQYEEERNLASLVEMVRYHLKKLDQKVPANPAGRF